MTVIVLSAKSGVAFVKNKTVFPQTMLEGSKNQLYKYFENEEK